MKCHGVLTDGSSKDQTGWQRGVELGRVVSCLHEAAWWDRGSASSFCVKMGKLLDF